MLEVIINFLLDQKLKLQNGEVEPELRPSSRRSNRSTREDNSSIQKSSNSVQPNIESQFKLDGFPSSQQDGEDDLLKPDPNFTYPTYQKSRQKSGANRSTSKFLHANGCVLG